MSTPGNKIHKWNPKKSTTSQPKELEKQKRSQVDYRKIGRDFIDYEVVMMGEITENHNFHACTHQNALIATENMHIIKLISEKYKKIK